MSFLQYMLIELIYIADKFWNDWVVMSTIDTETQTTPSEDKIETPGKIYDGWERRFDDEDDFIHDAGYST